LVDDLAEDEGETLRYAGYRRSKELLELHRGKVEHIAHALAERTELDQVAIEQILISDG
jgi:ATP-dependent Zn protease